MDERNEFQRRIGVGERQHRYGRHVGTSRTTVVPREDNGKPAGTQTEHWSGRTDATAFAATPPVQKVGPEARAKLRKMTGLDR